MSHYFIGVDVGGTKTEVCLLSLSDLKEFEQFQILARERIPTRRKENGGDGTLEDYLKPLSELIHKLIRETKLTLDRIQGIGFGLPGSIDPVTQVMAQGSIPFFNHRDLKTEFAKAIGYTGPMIFDNDANCFALAETYLGAGKRWAKENNVPLNQLCLVGVTLGTGVGGGLIVNGRLIRGRRGGAGEIGHITLVEAGRPCYCGKRGCVEQYLSGRAFEYSYSSRASALEKLKGTEIFKLAENGEPLAIATIEHYRDDLVTFLSNVSNFLDPHVIVLGGGMSSQPRIYDGISERLSRECFLTENPPGVIQNECGGSSGVLGAALLSIWSQEGVSAS
jgi:fructokinase